jgi:hypothetical protein
MIREPSAKSENDHEKTISRAFSKKATAREELKMATMRQPDTT